jgi:hypothetical protein
VLDEGHLTPTVELSRVSIQGVQSMDIVGGTYPVSLVGVPHKYNFFFAMSQFDWPIAKKS